MTDRYRKCVIVFDREIREDDLEPLLNALRMIKGVAAVELEENTSGDWTARMMVRTELRRKLYDAIDGVFDTR